MTVMIRIALTLFAGLSVVGVAGAQGAADAANEANNPLTAKVGLSFQDQYVGEFRDNDEWLNSFLLRVALPHRVGGHPQLLRTTVPVVTAPRLDGRGHTNGLGDINVFDLFLFKRGALEFAVGPQLSATAWCGRNS